MINLPLVTALFLVPMAHSTSTEVPDGARLTPGESCYAVELNGRVVGATRQTVRAALYNGRRAWRIEIHQQLPDLQFDVRDTFLVDRSDLSAIRYESNRLANVSIPAQEVRVDYGPTQIRGFKRVGEIRTDLDVSRDLPVWDGNLWGLTFAGMALYEGAEHTLPFWHYEKGEGEFSIRVVGSETIETPHGPEAAWIVNAGDGSGATTTYLIGQRDHAELGYSTGPIVQRLGGDCSRFPPAMTDAS